MGLTGELIIRDIVAGERDPKALARHRHSRVKASTHYLQQFTDLISVLHAAAWRCPILAELVHYLRAAQKQAICIPIC